MTVEKQVEVYWTDQRNEPRGAKFTTNYQAVGFMMGLQKDERVRDVYGVDREGDRFTCDEFGQ